MIRIEYSCRIWRAARARGALFGTGALLVVAAGCGSSTKAPASSRSPTTTAAAPTTAATPAPSGTAGAAVAKPGTSLMAGQAATVLFTTTTSSGAKGKSYRLKVTVDSIQKGTLSDFNGVQLDANEKASTPAYVRVHVTNLGPGDIDTSNSDPAIEIEGVDNTGQTQQSVTFLGTFPRCPDKDTPKPLAAGQTFSTCLTFLVPGGITKAAYTGTDDYISSPVTWTAG